MNDYQLDRSDLAKMSADQILAAEKAGRLNRLMGRPYSENADQYRAEKLREAAADVREGYGDEPTKLTRADLKNMTYREIEDARERGDLDHLLYPGGADR